MAPSLLFLPGTLCDARLWDHSYRVLSADWPCAFIDYRFQVSTSAMAAEALAQVAGPVIPIGLSMGGIVALEIWRKAAERVLALAIFDLDPGADLLARRTRRDAQVLCATQGDFRAMVETQLAPTYFSREHPSTVKLTETVVAMALDQGVRAFAAQATALATRKDAWDLLNRIDVPSLVACGDDDRICPPELHARIAKLIPKATFRTIRAAGHLPPLEQPEATTDLLLTWLDGLAFAQEGFSGFRDSQANR